MKRMFLNKAIVSYANFVKRVVNLKDNENDVATKEQYKKFLNYYRNYQKNGSVMDDASSILFCTDISGMQLVKIYYSDIIQVWAFVHILVVKKNKGKGLLSFSSKSNEDLTSIKEALHSLWYAEHHDETYAYAYLEDDEVMLEVKMTNMIKQMERHSEVLKMATDQIDFMFA